jgi:hypothetical protein
MSDQDMTTGAREAIRIAEETFPTDMRRQEALAKKIINAINICESEMAEEIIQRVRASEARVQ